MKRLRDGKELCPVPVPTLSVCFGIIICIRALKFEVRDSFWSGVGGGWLLTSFRG
jgi:hypothetical protein